MTEYEFAKKCEDVAYDVLTAWTTELTCYYDESPYRKKEFVLEAYHHWGSAYCDWDGTCKRSKLFQALRECGATNISGKVTWNRVEIIFNMKKRLKNKVEPKKE